MASFYSRVNSTKICMQAQIRLTNFFYRHLQRRANFDFDLGDVYSFFTGAGALLKKIHNWMITIKRHEWLLFWHNAEQNQNKLSTIENQWQLKLCKKIC